MYKLKCYINEKSWFSIIYGHRSDALVAVGNLLNASNVIKVSIELS